jgi:hypothetical protein
MHTLSQVQEPPGMTFDVATESGLTYRCVDVSSMRTEDVNPQNQNTNLKPLKQDCGTLKLT